jgi:arylsulfatase A-like enzyme
MIEGLDRSVGEIVETLQRLMLDRRTLVFFTSDNGGILRMAGVGIKPENRISSNAPFRGQKHGLYEGGHRVPAIAWWPGKISAAQESAELAMTMDLMPTILELCGANPVQTPCDGISVAAHLLSREILPERTICWRSGNSRAVRWKNWKLVRIHEGPFELYDLSRDPSEKTDLATTHSSVTNELLSRLNAWEAGFRNSRVQQK